MNRIHFSPTNDNNRGEGAYLPNQRKYMKIDEIYNLRDKKLKELGYSSYQEYLLSDEWKQIKDHVRNRTARKWNFCNICGSDKKLDLHHSSYKVIGLKHPGNTVRLLCRECHELVHEQSRKNPDWSLYKIAGKIKSARWKAGLSIFPSSINGNTNQLPLL